MDVKSNEQIVNEVLTSSMPIKVATKWEDLSYDAQKEYLKAHRGSKKKMTAKPGLSVSDLKEKIKEWAKFMKSEYKLKNSDIKEIEKAYSDSTSK